MRQIGKCKMVDREVTLNILADAYCSLLTIKHFKIAIIIFNPVHHVQRKILCDGTDNFVTLFVFIDKFPLKSWADIQPSIVSHDTVLSTVLVSCNYFSHRNLM